MKYIIKLSFLAMFLMTGSLLLAQETTNNNLNKKEKMKSATPEERAQMMTDKLTKELNLTVEQQAKIKQLNLDFANQMQISDLERDEQKALFQAHRSEIQSILTAEQAEKLSEMKSERRKHRSHKMDPEKRAEMKAIHQEMRQAQKAYRQEHINPVMQEKRAELEALISDQDKATIEQLRLKKEQAKKAKKAQVREEMKDQKQSEALESHRKHGRGHHRSLLSEVDRQTLESLLQKYNNDIQSIFESIQSEEEEWKAERKKMATEILEKHDKDSENFDKRRHEKRDEAKSEERRKEREAKREAYKKARFLLMAMDTNEINERTASDSNVKLYPNPASDFVTINYPTPVAGQVKIEFIDANGRNVLQTNQRVEIGENALDIDVSGLPAGNYITKMTQGEITMQSRIVISK